MTGESAGPQAARRALLRWLAAAPLLAGAVPRALAENAATPSRPPDPMVWAPRDPHNVISEPRQALSVLDFEPAAREALSPSHFGYLATGIDDEVTLRANRAGFEKFQLRPRRLVDVSRVDLGIEILGQRWGSPIAIAPTASNRAFHADGELAVARAARAGNHLQILSTLATASIEQAIEARGAPVWFQLYPTNRWEVAEALAKRAERAGVPVLVVTVDVLARQNWETYTRLRRTDSLASCGSCHSGTAMRDYLARKPNFEGIGIAGLSSTGATNLTWDTIRRLRDAVTMKIVLKGILAHEDASLAAEAGIDGIIVSNHGGRGEDSGRSTIEALPEIVAAVRGRMPVLIDSGFRRGTDVVKALALGASAVCVGRPYLWGLSAFGQPGVERVLELLRTETRAAMEQVGAPTVRALVPAMVHRGVG
jgi:4-hydroxymandelate oxidase